MSICVQGLLIKNTENTCVNIIINIVKFKERAVIFDCLVFK